MGNPFRAQSSASTSPPPLELEAGLAVLVGGADSDAGGDGVTGGVGCVVIGVAEVAGMDRGMVASGRVELSPCECTPPSPSPSPS